MVAQLINVGGYTAEHRGFSVPEPLRERLAAYSPRTDLGRIARACFRHLPPDLAGELLDAISRSVVVDSALSVAVLRPGRPVLDLGVVSRKVITDNGVGFIVDAWQNIVELEIMKYHGIGTGTTAEAASQTALVTESTTALNPDSTRATGTTVEGATGNIFRSVGTLTVDAAVAVTEHALFSQAATGGGTMFDRSVFSAVNLASGDSIQTTYECTFTSGG